MIPERERPPGEPGAGDGAVGADLVAPEDNTVMTEAEARALTDRLKVAVNEVWNLVVEAYAGRAWVALGYQSWDDYRTREFGSGRLRLPREERKETVGSLRNAGLSIRAIASATGASKEHGDHRPRRGVPNWDT